MADCTISCCPHKFALLFVAWLRVLLFSPLFTHIFAQNILEKTTLPGTSINESTSQTLYMIVLVLHIPKL